MKKFFALSVKTVLIFVCLVLFSVCNRRDTSEANVLDKDTSYAMGMFMANMMAEIGFHSLDYDYDAFRDGFKAFNEAGETRISWEQAIDRLNLLVMQLQSQASDEFYLEEERNRVEGDAYLAQNRARSGVITTSSGLQYEIINQGSGQRPGPEDDVLAHYIGTFINGEVFDSSHVRGEPAEFNLSWVIPGWTEGLQLMNEGSTFRFVVPSNLAYGPEGRGPIPPGATLIFTVELISILR